jgi:hypothetical protein
VAGDIEPAVRAGLVETDRRTGWVSFRHPLVRATVLEQSAEADRRRAHGLLAQLLPDQPDRWVSHLAESTAAADERISGLLDRAAIRAQRSGGAARAVDLLERSAELSPAPAARAGHLARAAYLAARVMGEMGPARALLADAGQSVRVASGLGSSPLGSSVLGSLPLGSSLLGSSLLGSSLLGSLPLGSSPLGSSLLGSSLLGSLPLGSSLLGSLLLGSSR